MIPPGYAKYEKNVSVACVNFQTKWGDKEANIKKTENLMRQAAQIGANIVVFPELSLTGFECSPSCQMHHQTAEGIPGPSTLRLATLCRELDMYLVTSLPERDNWNPDDLYISIVLISPNGIAGVYRKLSFARRSAGCFKTGDSLPIFETRYGPVGLQTCSNLWLFPEFSRIMALKGARLILNPTASPSGPGKALFLRRQTCARGTENGVYVASSNLVGKELEYSYYGHSMIAGPSHPKMGDIYTEAGEEEEMVSAVLSFDRLHAYRESQIFPYGLHLKLVAAEFSKIASSWHEPDRIFPREPLKGHVEDLDHPQK